MRPSGSGSKRGNRPNQRKFHAGMRRDEDEVMDLTTDELARVTGGYSDADFGRCGPGSHWKFLGDVRTPQ